jgi:protoheme IX farnesyltransferase
MTTLVLSPTTESTASDYWQLLKLRVISLAVFTVLVWMIIAPGSIHPVIAIAAILCIAVGVGQQTPLTCGMSDI